MLMDGAAKVRTKEHDCIIVLKCIYLENLQVLYMYTQTHNKAQLFLKSDMPNKKLDLHLSISS